MAITKKLASRAHAGLFLALFERFLSTEDHTKYIGKNGSDCMLFFTWVINLINTKKLRSTRLCAKHIVLDICPMMLYEAKLMMGYDELMMGYDAL